MFWDQMAETLNDRLRKVRASAVAKVRLIEELGSAKRLLEVSLSEGQEHAELGSSHGSARAQALCHLVR